MKKNGFFPLFFGIILLLSACGGGYSKEKSAGESTDKAMEMNTSEQDNSKSESVAFTESDGNVLAEQPVVSARMVIYNANLHLKVKNFQKSQASFEEKVKSYQGYIVESNIYRESKEIVRGYMTIRIPAASFEKFLHDAEGLAAEVIERQVSGEDVTEEFVDLESRLKSKKVVEERLMEFMKKAEKTEDLLKISSDLAKVQEEIEQIAGRMKYLNNLIAYSTVNIEMSEDLVVIPSIDNTKLNTWEKTKKQFAVSTNALLAFLSGTIVVIFGNLPFFILLGAIITILVVIIKRARRRKQSGD
ncbi:DUF4349 domain-containing protein [Bacillus sp. FJAT-29790]|uniref:DUF4349 domain-containing protein n=1 Tax=Bacillus sp. FJAT-29790 TaxID=1895002 RepID=UPI001C23D5B3|nr:DUF4349 domain-containing protein [Bacillus sp. FJAT-29790]MBU8877643.1 DUF4349 domain-containing protein [Bacillus sp. FJAT-29790]